MTKIHDTIIGADGRPVANVGVTVQLCAAPDLGVGEGFDLDALETIAAAGTTTTDATGKWSMTDVTPNTDINPTGTVYRVTYTTPTKERQCFLVNVPDTTLDVWVGSIVTVPEGELVTIVQGPPGPPGESGMTQAQADARYVNVTGDVMSGNLTLPSIDTPGQLTAGTLEGVYVISKDRGAGAILGLQNAAGAFLVRIEAVNAAFRNRLAVQNANAFDSVSIQANESNTGYVAFHHPANGVRMCYVGYVSPTAQVFEFVAETMINTFNFNKPVTVNGTPVAFAVGTSSPMSGTTPGGEP